MQADCLHEAGCDIVRVTVHLPNISRAKDLDLEVVDGQTLTIKLPNGTHFSAAIPKPVQEDSVSAKFDKHAKMLTVTMQCT